jgi:hypothetical protein
LLHYAQLDASAHGTPTSRSADIAPRELCGLLLPAQQRVTATRIVGMAPVNKVVLRNFGRTTTRVLFSGACMLTSKWPWGSFYFEQYFFFE